MNARGQITIAVVKDGESVARITNYYAWGASGTTPPSGTWSEDAIPAHTYGADYLWKYEVSKGSEGTVISTSDKSCVGFFPDGVVDVKDLYKLSSTGASTPSPIPTSSGTTLNVNGWSETPLSTTSTMRYLWTCQCSKLESSTWRVGTPHVCAVQGVQGAKGDSIAIKGGAMAHYDSIRSETQVLAAGLYLIDDAFGEVTCIILRADGFTTTRDLIDQGNYDYPEEGEMYIVNGDLWTQNTENTDEWMNVGTIQGESIEVQYSHTNTEESSWHNPPMDGSDVYMRTRMTGQSWSDSIRIKGIDGKRGSFRILKWSECGSSFQFYDNHQVSNDISIADVVIDDSTGGNDSKYLCISGYMSNGQTPPHSDSTHWRAFNEFSNVATGLLLADYAVIDKLLLNNLKAYSKNAAGQWDTSTPTIEIDGSNGQVTARKIEVVPTNKEKNTDKTYIEWKTAAFGNPYIEMRWNNLFLRLDNNGVKFYPNYTDASDQRVCKMDTNGLSVFNTSGNAVLQALYGGSVKIKNKEVYWNNGFLADHVTSASDSIEEESGEVNGGEVADGEAEMTP